MTIRLLATGQSNAVGQGGAGGFFPTVTNVRVWNNLNNVNTLASLGSAFVVPNRAANPFVSGWNNMFFHAARHIADLYCEDVELIIVAMGNQAISQWADGAPLYERMKGVWQAAGSPAIDAFLWHQGEANNIAPTGYAAKFDQLLANMEADGIICSSTPAIIGEVAPIYPVINPILRDMETDRIKCARIMTLGTIDEIHFSAGSLEQAGWQYAKKFRELRDGPWAESNMDFVSAAAYQVASFPNNVDVRIPVTPVYGDASWIDTATGAFVAPVNGIYRFNARIYVPGGQRNRLMLLDASGGVLGDALAYDVTAGSAVVSGFADLDLAAGTSVFLGARQVSGGTVSATAAQMASFNKMSVTLLSQHS